MVNDDVPLLPTGPIPKPGNAYERRLAVSPLYTEHLQVGDKPYEIKLLFWENRYHMVKGVNTRIAFYKVYVTEPSGVVIFATRGSLWKVTRFMEYFHTHATFQGRSALIAAADRVEREAACEATALYTISVD